jgi:hypothetical protein
LGIRGQAGEEEALFAGSFAADGAFRFEHGEAAQSLPPMRLTQTLELIERIAAACFHAAEILVHRLGKRVRGIGSPMGAKTAPEIIDRLGEPGRAVLHRQHIVGWAFLNGLGGAVCVRMASRVTVQPVTVRVESNSGMTLISLDFSSVTPLAQH